MDPDGGESPQMQRTVSKTEYFSMSAGEEHEVADDANGGSGGSGCAPPSRSETGSGRLVTILCLAALAVAIWLRPGSSTEQEVEALRAELRATEAKLASHDPAARAPRISEVQPASVAGELVRGASDTVQQIAQGPARARKTTPELPQVAVHRVPAGNPRLTPEALEDEWPPPVRAAEPLEHAERYAGAALGASPASAEEDPREVRLRPGLMAAGSEPAVPAAKLQAKASVPTALSSSAGAGLSEHEEFACVSMPRPQWAEVRAATARQLGAWSAAVEPIEVQELSGLLTFAVEQLQAHQRNKEECSLGRLSMSVLAVVTAEVGGSLHTVPSLRAPLLRALLEVPWAFILASGWPLFALLAQMHQRTHGVDDLPRTGGHLAEYLGRIRTGLERREPGGLAKAGAAFLEHDGKADGAEEAHAMPMLCALASQLLGDDLAAGEETLTALQLVQGFFKQTVQSMDDLHACVISAWPLFGLLHAAAVRLTEGQGKLMLMGG